MVRVGDLVEPGPEEVGLTCLPPLVGSHESPRRDPDGSMESRLPGRSNCQKSPPSRPETGKHEYVPRPKTHSRSDIWKCFTDDAIGPIGCGHGTTNRLGRGVNGGLSAGNRDWTCASITVA